MTRAAFGKELNHSDNSFFGVLYTKSTVLNERSVSLFQYYYLDCKFEKLFISFGLFKDSEKEKKESKDVYKRRNCILSDSDKCKQAHLDTDPV